MNKRLNSKNEAENLQLRCEVLASEEQSLLTQLKDFDARVLNERQQIRNIETEKVKVQQQIDALADT